MSTILKTYKLYLISLAEGSAVMAAEICGAKLLAPIFGSSLYVWSSIMAITLGGLASGYFIGGQLSKRPHKEKQLLIILFGAIIFICLMPTVSLYFNTIAYHLSLIPAVILASCAIIFPPMLCLGAASPLIISLLTSKANESGENSGKIYAISTLGGIIATFLCGFYLIPSHGIMFTLFSFAGILGLTSLMLIPILKNKKLFGIIILPLLISIYSFSHIQKNKFTIFQTEGIFGKLEIRDEPQASNPDIIIRRLLINNIIQTEMNLQSNQPVSDYIRLFQKNIHYMPKGDALLLGLGGGVLANLLSQNEYHVTSVEFDERVINVANRFFYLNKNITTLCDDARHYINVCDKKFNLIVCDLYKSEEQPSYVITQESLKKIKKLLTSNGVMLINTHGYLAGNRGLGTQCLLSTLKNAGFDLKICTTSEDEDYRNLLIVASLKPLNITINNEISPIIYSNTTIINTDNKPVLEYLNAPANKSWRYNYLRNYILTN
jgi:predicted membrane-bound spermidine synthase